MCIFVSLHFSCFVSDEKIRLKGFEQVVEILKRLCIHSNIARIMALRELIERSLFSVCNTLFGAKPKAIRHENTEKMLLKQNKKLVSNFRDGILFFNYFSYIFIK